MASEIVKKTWKTLKPGQVQKRFDLTGEKFGKLTVTGLAGKNKFKAIQWHCRCECGGTSISLGKDLRGGYTKSCGCLRGIQIVHGLRSVKEYQVWSKMKQRCLNKNNLSYHGYGGRGITVCRRWEESFESFYKDMGSCPDGFSLDRIDNSKGYSPENCRWADRKTQIHNRSNSVGIDLKSIAKERGFSYKHAYNLYRAGRL